MNDKIRKSAIICMSGLAAAAMTACMSVPVNRPDVKETETVIEDVSETGEAVETEESIMDTDVESEAEITPGPDDDSISSEDQYELADAMSSFALNLLNEISEEADKNENILLSPDSIATALAMAGEGAADETKEELNRTIFADMDAEKAGRILSAFNMLLISDPSVSWHMANSLWLKDDKMCIPKDAYKEILRDRYNAEFYEEPFDPSTVEKINEWVDKNTSGMIPRILESLPLNARLCLINAMAFEGAWADPVKEYDIKENETFTNADGSASYSTMLTCYEDHAFRLGNGTGFIKYYEGFDYAFVGILPDEGILPSDYIHELAESGESFASAVRESNEGYRDVTVYMPEFDYDYSLGLNETLKKLGIMKAFNPEEADFSNMLEEGSEPVYIGDVIHKTHIELDRNGTKAAAATAVMIEAAGYMEPSEEPLEIRLDRPFAYAIVKAGSGMPVFMGYVNKL